MSEALFIQRKYGSRIADILIILFCVILLPVVIVNLTLIIKSYVNPADVPDFMGYKSFIVGSGSMEPAMNVGDLIIIKEVDTGQLEEGDIISFREGDIVVTHRIIDITETNGERTFLTQGDANNTADGVPITDDMIEGRLLHTIPHLGDFALFIQTPLGFMLTVVLPLILLVVYLIWSAWRSEQEKQAATLALEAELNEARAQLKSQAEATAAADQSTGPQPSY